MCIGVLFTALVLSTGVLISVVDYASARRLVLDVVSKLFESSARETLAELRASHEPIRTLVAQLAEQPRLSVAGPQELLASLGAIRRSLDLSPMLSAIYVGFADGGLFYIRRLDFAAARRSEHAPPAAAYMVQISQAGQGSHVVHFYDAGMVLLSSSDTDRYRPRDMRWFAAALARPDLVRTPAFALPSRDIGFAIAQATPDRLAVVGADLALKDLSASLSRQRASPSAQLALTDRSGQVLAASQGAWTVADGEGVALPDLAGLGMNILADAFSGIAGSSGSRTINSGGRDWETMAVTAELADGDPLYLVMAAPHDELLAGVRDLRRYALFTVLLILFVAVPLTWWIARRISLSLQMLAGDAASIRHFRFEGREVRSFVLEVDDLAQAMTGMRTTIQRFLVIAEKLSAERNFQRLLDGLIDHTVTAARAQAGAIYLMDDEHDSLLPSAWHRVDLARLSDPPPAIALDLVEDRHPLRAACRERGMGIGQLGAGSIPQGMGWLASCFPGQTVSYLAMPLSNSEGRTIGVLFLGKSASDVAFTSEQAAFVEALSGTVAVAIDNQRLLRAQKSLLDAVIRVIAGAIDAKSPYTGGHCQRVPELTLMLARAACASDSGPFRDFSLTDTEWESLSIAAWLHDCGKLTTPEYVVDKATKLETLYDRIHEIRTRFEVLKRDADIAYWQGLAEGGDRVLLGARREEELARLDDDFAFVAACNIGGEYLPDAAQERLLGIARRTWRRTLDDRLGISVHERCRKERRPALPLPVEERLIADRDDHLIAHQPGPALPADIKVTAPAFRLNLGELHSLSVRRGTLTAEERFLINHHIVQSIVMLRGLPFPEHLRLVPEIAGNHHEHLDGSGYPRGLRAEDMSPQARMMAIADIFEALTASDRPYKQGKTLSEAVGLLADYVRMGHLDPDLFALFLLSETHLGFARRFLNPAQIDEVDSAAALQRAGLTC